MLDDADADVRASALEAVVALDAETPLSTAEAALRSGFEDVRVRGLDRLVKLGAERKRPEGAEPLLGDALEDESAKVRGEAFRTLWAWNEKEPQKALDRALDRPLPGPAPARRGGAGLARQGGLGARAAEEDRAGP